LLDFVSPVSGSALGAVVMGSDSAPALVDPNLRNLVAEVSVSHHSEGDICCPAIQCLKTIETPHKVVPQFVSQVGANNSHNYGLWQI